MRDILRQLTINLLFGITCVLPFSNLIAQTWVQQGTDIDGKVNFEGCGYSVSSSSDGNTVAIGVPFNSGGGTNRGQVRVYKLVGGTWIQQGGDINGDVDNIQSGRYISLSSDGTTVAIAVRNCSNGNGRVGMYKLVSGVWMQQGTYIYGEGEYCALGMYVSLSSDGSIVAIGSPENAGGDVGRGRVRVFKLISGVWTQQGIDINGKTYQERSGSSVSLSSDGSIVAIGVPYYNSPQGQVRIYKLVSGTWTQLGGDINGKLAVDDYFGGYVSLSSDGMTVATTGASGIIGYNRGQVRVYKLIGGIWTQQGVNIEGKEDGDAFGSPVSLSSDGTTFAAGAPTNSGGGLRRGQVRVYKLISGTWTQQGPDINGEIDGEQIGFPSVLSSDGTTVVISSPNSAGGGFVRGHVRVYKNSSVLPIELLDFRAISSVSSNQLMWATTNEINNRGFQIERSPQPPKGASTAWTVLGFVNAQNKASTYTFIDINPLPISYYRLRQIDNDGKEELSKVISISAKVPQSLKIYPNIVKDFLTVETDNTDDFVIVNLLGQQVLRGKTAQQIDVSALPQGAYLLRVGSEAAKFVKE